ncbi:hypothetical protein [Pelomonas cellulosilytica]|uniref:Uncharacterized protein n=1 Tax=Pelomonas cellulosilytica TaxID=2906762 RepID=A0ABS8XQI2_9BURK|nr:hypothetical protein [Pelomonas sp. P8]MCE4555009.1 hypothetical protein [Pelomonas sp. P8]
MFDGVSPAGSSLVDGQKHWFAKGQYVATGKACQTSSQDRQVGDGAASKPEDTCNAGQAKGTINGKSVCVDQSASDPTKPASGTESSASEKTDKTSVTNPDGSTTTTETTTKIDSKGNKEVTVIKTTTRPDGTSTVDKQVTNPGAASDGKGDDNSDKGECEKNPASAGCGGEPASIGDLYQPKDKSLQSVLQGHRDAFMSSPFGSAVGGFFVVSGGAGCPTWTGHIPYLDTDITIDQFCSSFATNALALLKICILLVSSFFAFRIAVE